MTAIAPLRQDVDRIFDNLKMTTPSMVLTAAKRDHIVWVDKLIRLAVCGEKTITEREVRDHTQCRLGQFLASEKDTARYTDRSRELVDVLNQASLAVLDLLDNMIAEISK